jgi:putative ABC transport system ATP-binding protein
VAEPSKNGGPNPRASAEPIIRLEEVTKLYQMGDVVVRALAGVSVTIEEGDFVAIMGSSGSGKSTMMNLIGCLDQPTGGRYLLGGRDVSTMKVNELAEIRNQMLGFVFQSFNLLARTSALENVELPLEYRGLPTKERHRRAREALARVGLGAREDHHPSQLSGGQQQRVAIARAIVGMPKVILADEPTGNLDSQTSNDVMALFQELGGSGMTVVLVTHEPDIAAFASRVIVMKDGKLQSDTRQVGRRATASPEAVLAAGGTP